MLFSRGLLKDRGDCGRNQDRIRKFTEILWVQRQPRESDLQKWALFWLYFLMTKSSLATLSDAACVL